MSSLPFLLDLVIILGAALLLGALCERLRQSAIVGYIAAGVLAGPFLHRGQSPEIMGTIAELGLTLLLFSIGLEFSWQRLFRIGRVALWGGLSHMALTIAAFVAAGPAFGFPFTASLVAGTIASMSSTAVVLRVLSDRSEVDSQHGRVTIGMTLLQDVAVIPFGLLIAFLSGGGGTLEGGLRALGLAAVSIVMLVIFLLAASRYVLPLMLRAAAGSHNREMAVLLSFILCLGAVSLAHALGLSSTLGAFVAGMFISGSPFAGQIRSDLLPLRAFFVAFFFVSVGMLVDLGWLLPHVHWVALFALAVTLAKLAAGWLALRLLGQPDHHALTSALALAQIGELAFVLVEVARGGGVLSPFLYQLMVCATPLTLLATPVLMDRAPAWGRHFEIFLRRRGWAVPYDSAGGTEEKQRLRNHVILAGFGPAGRRVALALMAVGSRVRVLDLNPESVEAARRMGLHARIGDATSADILRGAGLERAQAMVVTIPDPRAAQLAVSQAKMLAPNVPVIARARFHMFADELLAAGADRVVDEEEMMGRELGDEILRRAGAPSEALEKAEQAALPPA